MLRGRGVKVSLVHGRVSSFTTRYDKVLQKNEYITETCDRHTTDNYRSAAKRLPAVRRIVSPLT
jgi:hypothetical protein